MSKLHQVAIIGFNVSGDITQVEKLSLDINQESSFMGVANIVGRLLGDDSSSVKVVCSQSMEMVFHSDDTDNIINTLKANIGPQETYIGELWSVGSEDAFIAEVTVKAKSKHVAKWLIIEEKWDVRLEITGQSPDVRNLKIIEAEK